MKRSAFSLLILPFVLLATLTLAALATKEPQPHRGNKFDLVEATIAEINDAFNSGLLTPSQLVRMYLVRIAAYDQAGPHLNSYMHVNEHALDAARDLEGEGGKHSRNRNNKDKPLFGIPVIVKDNINTSDMPTTAGSGALGGSIPPADAFIVKRLRQAGAIILGKATPTEWANFLTSGMPSGYSSQLRFQLGGTDPNSTLGYGFNPYDPRTDPRTGLADGRPALTPGGSSSGPGIAVAANLATVGVGTETSGSILSPATANYLVGIKPTRGLISRTGIVPITADQDTAGPMARTVTDAAKLLGVLAGFDPQDAATAPCRTRGNCWSDYTPFLNKQALKGARIAVPYFSYWTDNKSVPNLAPAQLQLMKDAIAVLRAEGAYVEEQHDIPDQAKLNAFSGCNNLPQSDCSTVLLYGFKHDLNAYLETLPPGAPVHNLKQVIEYNNAHSAFAIKYGQVLALAAETLDIDPKSADTARYLQDRAKDIDLAKTQGLDAVFSAGFDAVLFPGNRGANIAARAGYPSIVVPGGLVANRPELNVPAGLAFPAGFDPKDAPYGVTFTGKAFSEPRLLGLAFAFEQATRHRRPPDSTPSLPSDTVTGR